MSGICESSSPARGVGVPRAMANERALANRQPSRWPCARQWRSSAGTIVTPACCVEVDGRRRDRGASVDQARIASTSALRVMDRRSADPHRLPRGRAARGESRRGSSCAASSYVASRPRRRCAGAGASAVGVVGAGADAGGGHRALQPGARPDRPGAAALRLCRRDRGQGARRGRPRLPARRARLSPTCCWSSSPTATSPRPWCASCSMRRSCIPICRRCRQSADARLAEIAAKAVKEMAYHVRHAAEWVIRLGDGTEESHARAAAALDELWMYTGELFEMDEGERALVAAGHRRRPRSDQARLGRDHRSRAGRGDLEAPGRPLDADAAAAAAATASTWAICWPRCRCCIAPIPARRGEAAMTATPSIRIVPLPLWGRDREGGIATQRRGSPTPAPPPRGRGSASRWRSRLRAPIALPPPWSIRRFPC